MGGFPPPIAKKVGGKFSPPIVKKVGGENFPPSSIVKKSAGGR